MYAIQKNGLLNPQLYRTQDAAARAIKYLYGSNSYAVVVEVGPHDIEPGEIYDLNEEEDRERELDRMSEDY
jgi:hypothetical protein